MFFFSLKILNIEGWIYIGKPNDPWVTYNIEKKNDILFARFNNGKINDTVKERIEELVDASILLTKALNKK